MTGGAGSRRADGCCGANPMQGALADEGMLDMAEEVARGVADSRRDARVAESSRRLFVACAALLRDWFEDGSYTPCGMETLLSLALERGKYDTAAHFELRRSALDLMFLQIERGVKYARGWDGEWAWRPSRFVRKHDGARPADTGGLPPGTDVAASFYASWRLSAPPDVLEESVYACIGEVARLGIPHGRA